LCCGRFGTRKRQWHQTDGKRVMFRFFSVYLLISETHNETYLPTFRRPPQAHSWLPRSHGNPRRPRRAQRTSRQRPQAPGCLSQALFAAGVTGDCLQTHLQDYARDRRIVKTDEFSSVFRLRPVYRTAHFVLYTRTNALPHARLGVVAAKRFAPRAVTRNTIKRVTRELFRQAALPSIDCIVRLSKPVNARSGSATSARLKAELRAELMRLFLSQRLPETH
jgi:ribonuclease P protein component